MNLKAERIEQLIQIVNRNLLLIYSGQGQDVTPMDIKVLQKVDIARFGADKFAFEMIHFVKNSLKYVGKEETMRKAWEESFVKGLETLLVECAIVRDEVEKDCFVSRVYSWFTEKLSERRNLPKQMIPGELDGLKSNIEQMGATSHTMKGLEKYTALKEKEESQSSASKLQRTTDFMDEDDMDFLSGVDGSAIGRYSKGTTTQTMRTPFKGSGMRSSSAIRPTIAYPDVLSERPDYHGFLPKIPGADDNYGMVFNKAETEAEKNMNELWVARRRQEAFDWKTKQHILLVMDRLALQKSRRETDSLRRQECNAHLKQRERSKSADGTRRALLGHDHDSHLSNTSRSTSPNNRFSGPERPTSAGRHSKLKEKRERTFRDLREQFGYDSKADGGNALGGTMAGNASSSSLHNPRSQYIHEDENVAVGDRDTKVKLTQPDGTEVEASVPRPGRTEVPKRRNSTQGPSVNVIPMRFRNEPPMSYLKKVEKQQYYMQLSDSDDEDKPDRVMAKQQRRTGGGGNKKQQQKQKQTLHFNRPKNNVIRERPKSATQFRQVAQNDPEFKVLYRYSNFRRMPLTHEQEIWLAQKEQERNKKTEELETKLIDTFQAKMAKASGKAGGKGGAKNGAKAGGNDKGGSKKVPEKPSSAKAKPRYKSAAEYMAMTFPNFDGKPKKGSTLDLMEDADTQGPMRTNQLMEVANIADAFRCRDMMVRESVLLRALVVPQDLPEAVCLEGMKEEGERLMANPLPEEYWRKFKPVRGKSAKKKKKS